MPSLTDSLSALADYSAQIHTLSASNLAPSGPYTTAYLDSLHLNPAQYASTSGRAKRTRPHSRSSGRGDEQAGVLRLIRDAQESEVRLFRFIGEAEVAGVGRIKRVEKRDEGHGVGRGMTGAMGVMVGGDAMDGGKDEVEVMLRTALRLVDDYRPMPRARATIASLLDTHHAQIERVAELELKIEEAANTQANLSSTSSSHPSESVTSASQFGKGKFQLKKLTFEEAVKAEESALRTMESQLAPLRASRAASSAASEGPEKDTAFTATTSLSSSPPPSTAPISSRTPAKTPQSYPSRNITNSLVNGTTPRRARATPGGPGGVLTEGFEFDRFSPLKFLGTPRAAGRAKNTKSTLREVMGSPSASGAGEKESLVGRGIFERRGTGAGLGASVGPVPPPVWDGGVSVAGSSQGGVGAGEQPDEDQTVRFASQASGPVQDAARPLRAEDVPKDEVMAGEDLAASVRTVKESDGVLEGVHFRQPLVELAIAKIKEGLPEMLRQGLSAGTESPETVTAIISHLARLARSDPSPPPSPSSHSTSTLSSNPAGLFAPAAPPITSQTILTANLLLALLRGDEAAASMSELKDELGSLARARGWEPAGGDVATTSAAGGMVTKCIYHVVGKRVAKIDRKAGARVMFAI